VKRPSITLASIGAAITIAGGLSACGSVVDREPNLIAGKEAFIAKCGSCHTLARAATKGNQGPNLDDAFHQALSEGMKRSTIRGVIARQIEIPNRRAQVDPATGEELIAMPAKLVKGDAVDDVAAYVAAATGRSGEDSGRLATVGQAQQKELAKAANGELDIPANPEGQLLYEFAAAEAPAGPIKLKSPNESGTDHNIALEGNGVNEEGDIVKDGGVSEVDTDLQPGEYTFFCSVPGHREGGMEGTLTVK
jgi:plastocyanin/cytochrome c2